MKTFDQINDLTAFAMGDHFECDEQVTDYFTTATMTHCFGRWECHPSSQEELDTMAALVIENRWHMIGGGS